MARWEVERNQTTTETALFDVEVTDAVNRFGRSATAWIEDTDGSKFDDYPRGTRVDIYVRPGTDPATLTVQSGEVRDLASGETAEYREANIAGEWNVAGEATVGVAERQRMFAGFVVERRETNRGGADILEIDIYSFDHFLRRNIVAEDLSGQTIADALQTIIETYTPVDYVAGNIEIVDDQTLTRSYRGEKVEKVLSSLSNKSGGEQYGVNNSLEFFFRSSETGSAPRGIANDQWLDYDVPEVGKESPNEITVFFDDGEQSVTVGRSGDKLTLQNNLGTSSPPTFGEEVSYPDIETIGNARDKANEILNEREPTLTGTVTTFDLYDAEPGDVLDVTIEPRGIDDTFRIAELTWRWGAGDVAVTIVEKRGDQDDLLVRMSDTLKGVEMRNANRDATRNRVTRTDMAATVATGGDVDGTTVSPAVITNDCRNKIRDGWAGEGTLAVAEIAVGNGTADPTRSDTSLANELARTSTLTESLPDSRTVEYSADLSETDVREVGLFASDGSLLARGLVDDVSLSSPVTVTISLTTDNDTSVKNAVVTATGQTAVRDVIADNSPTLPTQYAYGTDGSDPAESDTSLGNQVDVRSLTETLVQSATSESDWTNVTPSFADTSPAQVTGTGELTVEQTSRVIEGENWDNATNGGFRTDSAYSGGSSAIFGTADPQSYEWEFSLPYPIPASDVGVAVRFETSGGGTPDIDWYLDGEQISTYSPDTTGISWQTNIIDAEGTQPSGEVAAGGHTFRGEVAATDTDSWWLDCFQIYDEGGRFAFGPFSYLYDNDNGGNDGYLDGPQDYPDEMRVELANAQTRREFDAATLEQTWDDTSNSQYLELSNDDGANWVRSANTQTFSHTFSAAATQLRAAVGLSRYGSTTGQTPLTGINGQTVDTHDLFADISAIQPTGIGIDEVQSIVPPDVLAGTTIREAGQLNSSDTTLTRAIFAALDILADERVISNERIAFDNA